jgi:ABC-type branched-subunit amino acid transport system ATPase component
VRLNRGAKFRDLLALVFLLAALATGCAAVQNPTLEGIREAYQKALRDPLIVRNAGAALDRAGQLLQVADEIWAEERDVAEVEHLAYLVQKRIEIARTIAKRRVAASDIQPQLSR